MSLTMYDLPPDIWHVVVREWISCPHELARFDHALCNRKYRQLFHNVLRGQKLYVNAIVPRNLSKFRRLLLWLISRNVKVDGLHNLEVSYIRDIMEFFDDCPDIGGNITSLSIRKTVSGTRNHSGMDKLPHLLSLMPNLKQFKSVLGSYYSPVYDKGPHYLTHLPVSSITHLSEEIGRTSDLDRIRSIQWPNLTHLSLHQSFIHDNCLFELLTSDAFCGLKAIEVIKFDEFNEVDLITNDMLQWHDLPAFGNLKSLNLNHWNQQAHSNNLSNRTLSNFLIHRSSQLEHVTLEGRYITDIALQLLLFTDRAKTLQSLTLRNSCETLDPTCALLSSIDVEKPSITPHLRTLILEQVPLTLIQSMLPLSRTVSCLRLSARHVPMSFQIYSVSPDARDSLLHLSCLMTENPIVPCWEEISLENISLSADDARWLLHRPKCSSLRKLSWKNFSGLDEDEMISIFSGNDGQERISHGLEVLNLHPSTQMSSIMSSSTAIAEAFVNWLRASKSFSQLRKCSTSYISLDEMLLTSLLMECPRLTSLSATHINSIGVTFQETCLKLQQSANNRTIKTAPLRFLHVSHLPHCHWPSLVILVRDLLPTLLQLQMEHCGQVQQFSSAEHATNEIAEGTESSVARAQSRLAMLWDLVESVSSRPCKIFVGGQRISPVTM